jgi:hypothetical protein
MEEESRKSVSWLGCHRKEESYSPSTAPFMITSMRDPHFLVFFKGRESVYAGHQRNHLQAGMNSKSKRRERLKIELPGPEVYSIHFSKR